MPLCIDLGQLSYEVIFICFITLGLEYVYAARPRHTSEMDKLSCIHHKVTTASSYRVYRFVFK